MKILPEILPADSCAPEHVMHKRQPLQYGFLGRILFALEVRRERKQLGQISAYLLRDIGISRGAADREAGRSIWDVPQNWQKAGSASNGPALHRELASPSAF